MQIESLMEEKVVLLIPVYSTRSYETGTYDLLADGNISKFLMKILNSNAKEIDIYYPRKSKNIKQIIKITNEYAKCKVNWIEKKYGENAHETRNMGQVFYDYVVSANKQYDLIISEIDTLAERVIESKNKLCDVYNFLYWVGSWNADGTRWDNIESSYRNKNIAQIVNTACLLPGQPELLKGKSFYDVCVYKPEFFDKKVIFFPFRLSDKSYHAEDFLKTIHELNEEGIDNFIVLYTDVNDSKLFDKEQINNFIKVPSNKFVYQAILKGKPIIPYLDDLSKNYHSNIFEFIYYNCDIITINKLPSTTIINDISELKEALKEKLRR